MFAPSSAGNQFNYLKVTNQLTVQIYEKKMGNEGFLFLGSTH